MFSKLRQLYQVLSRKEKWALLLNAAVFALATILLSITVFLNITEEVPLAGGRWTEGIIGQPVFINPAVSGNDVDQEISRLLFANLDELGTIKSDAEGLEWTVRLNEKLRWEDGEKITSDDLIFTIQVILDPESRSPLSQSLEGATISRVSELETKFILPSAYAFFETTLKNIRPIPRHIWGNIPPANFRLSRQTLKPIGSGPYKFASYKKERNGFISEYRLIRNKNYAGKQPFINEIVLKFFPDEDELIAAYNRGLIDGFMLNNPQNLSKIKIRHYINRLTAPRYFAVFINQALQPTLKNASIRRLLDRTAPRKQIIEEALQNFGRSLTTPLWEFENASQLEPEPQIDELNSAPLSDEPLVLALTIPDLPVPTHVAEILKKAWKQIGIDLNIVALSPFEVHDAIKKRNYELLLFGNTLNEPEDLYSFWHSTNRFYPGSNLSLYRNNEADFLIEKIRSEFDPEQRRRDLQKLISIISADTPAIFLYSPDYLYITSPRLRGFEENAVVLPADRFNHITSWYVKSGRKLR